MVDAPHTPIPVTAETRPFWAGCAEGKLLYQYCGKCAVAQFYPRKTCVTCGDEDVEWRESGRRGIVFSFTVVERAPTPGFKAGAPYVLALIDVAEGFRMMLNIVGERRFDTAIGSAVSIGFRARENGDVLPVAELSS